MADDAVKRLLAVLLELLVRASLAYLAAECREDALPQPGQLLFPIVCRQMADFFQQSLHLQLQLVYNGSRSLLALLLLSLQVGLHHAPGVDEVEQFEQLLAERLTFVDMRYAKTLGIGEQETRHAFDVDLHLLGIVHQLKLIVALEHPPELLHLDLHPLLHVLL